MKKYAVKAQEAFCEGKKLPCAYIRSLSSIHMGKVPESIEEDEVLEARFFSGNKEYHIYRYEDELRAFYKEEENGDCIYEKNVRLEPAFGSRLTIKTTLEFDEDGQTYAADVRMADWKEGK